MTVQELYESIGGNYGQALSVLRMDKLIDRYVRKYDPSAQLEKLREAEATLNPGDIFEAAHAMKGVCGNLGFDPIAEQAALLTEEFRPGSARRLTDEQVRAILKKLEKLNRQTVDAIRAYSEQ